MSEEQIREILSNIEKEFGALPNPEHEPLRFAYLVKLYRYLYNV